MFEKKMDKFVVRSSQKGVKRVLESRDGEKESTKRLKTSPQPEGTELAATCSDVVQAGKSEHTDAKAPALKKWRKIKAENLDLDYCKLYSQKEADELFIQCEKELVYNTGQLAKVQIFGRWHDIPRKQVAHGDTGLTYSFSNNSVPARPWTPFLNKLRDRITEVTGHTFNFVLINRYNDGKDHMGEHRDDEKDLVPTAPIASLTLGQSRDFIFKHCEARGKNAKRKMEPVKIVLEHGWLLLMNHPTNTYWYHSLPVRKGVKNVRINMTFRQMVVK